MNVVDERPDPSNLTKALTIIAAAWMFAILAGAFWLVMTAIQENRLGYWAVLTASAVYITAILGGVWLFYRVMRRMSDCVPSLAMERYRRRQMVAAGVYAVLLFAAIWAHPALKPQTLLAYVLAILPALPVVGMVVAAGLYLREETDEFERRVHAEGALWATGGILALATIWGFTEFLAGAPHLPLWLLVPIWAVMLSFGVMITRRRYR